jgi:two-component system chemotaxis response regulator CheB
MRYRAVVIGASAGGIHAIKAIITALPRDFQLPVVIVQHLSPISDNYWITLMDGMSLLTVKEADEKEKIRKGTIYIAPPNYHLLIERDETFSLSVDPKVNYARPSIDVLFESAADAYTTQLIGVVLTGANNDGALGLRRIKEQGGLAIVQDPRTAESSSMPEAAIAATPVDYILPLEEIIQLLATIQ